MKNIFILGAGHIGQALTFILKPNPNLVIELWDKDTTIVPNQKSLPELARWADVIMVCLNSWVMPEAVRSIQGDLRPAAVVLTVSKGIENDTGKTMDDLLPALLPAHQPYGIVSGPMLASELSQAMGGGAVLALSDRKLLKPLRQVFTVPGFAVDFSFDLRGVALAGVLKNIYAVGLGIGAGLGWGHNLHGWYVTQALKEMRQMVKILGGQEMTILTLAGIGDFVATGFSADSKNHQLGKELVTVGTFTSPSEGYASLPALARRLAVTDRYPIFEALRKIISENGPPEKIFKQLVA